MIGFPDLKKKRKPAGDLTVEEDIEKRTKNLKQIVKLDRNGSCASCWETVGPLKILGIKA